MHLDSLEPRRLMSVTLDPAGTLIAIGTDRDDTITMTVAGGSFRVVEQSRDAEGGLVRRSYAFAAAKVKRVYADAKVGADTIQLDATVKVPSTLIPGTADPFEVGTVDLVYGGAGADRIIGNGRSGMLVGGGGNDYIETRGETHVEGGAGDDTIAGFGGSDVSAHGGPGVDRYDASRGRGGVLGNNADVRNAGYDMPNRSYTGFENWVGTEGGDVIIGSAGRNIIGGRGGNDLIVGNGGDDELYGGAGNDQIYGGTGADALFGDAGDDVFYTRDGVHDFLSGGTGYDQARRDAGDQATGVERLLA